MNCKRRQERSSCQKPKSKITLQGVDAPWQKLRVFSINKVCCFVGSVKSVGKIIEDKLLLYYSTPTSKSEQYKNKVPFRAQGH